MPMIYDQLAKEKAGYPKIYHKTAEWDAMAEYLMSIWSDEKDLTGLQLSRFIRKKKSLLKVGRKPKPSKQGCSNSASGSSGCSSGISTSTITVAQCSGVSPVTCTVSSTNAIPVTSIASCAGSVDYSGDNDAADTSDFLQSLDQSSMSPMYNPATQAIYDELDMLLKEWSEK